MLTIYWACLLGGLALTLLAFFVGDALEGVLDALDSLDGLVDPLSLMGGITCFGGAGVILATTTDLGDVPGALLAAGIGLASAVVMHFLYVRPMKSSENSSGYSLKEMQGRIGEVLTTIPARGYGEVLIRMGPSNTFRQAASFNHTEIASGAKVVVVEVRDGDLWVAPFEESDEAPPLASSPERPALVGPSETLN
jgi:membrane-bound ClpP family serine protease